MRILTVGNMYPPHSSGGYELTWRAAVLHLRAAGHEVRVLTTDYREPGVDRGAELDADVHRTLRWYWRDFGFPRIGLVARIRLERYNGALLEHHLDDFRPDVVNWWAMGGMSLSLVERVRRRGLRAVGVVGDEWMNWGPRVDRWTRFTRRWPRVARAAERFTGIPGELDLSAAGTWLFNSDHTRRVALAAGWTLRDGRVEHPGVELEIFRPRPERPWSWRLLYVGRIDPRKGIATAIDALATLPAEATLTVVGSGDERHLQELRDLAARRGVAARTSFARARRDDLAERYSEADALVFPVTWDEPWGLVPLEAMATGTPVVATGTGGSAEYLRHEHNCLIFEPRGDADALAGALRRLASDASLRSRLRCNGFDTAAGFPARAYDEAIRQAIEEAAASTWAEAAAQ